MKKKISFLSVLYLVMGLIIVVLSWAGMIYSGLAGEMFLAGLEMFGNFVFVAIAAVAALAVFSAVVSCLTSVSERHLEKLYQISVLLLGGRWLGEVIISLCFIEPWISKLLIIFLLVVINATDVAFILLSLFVPYIIKEVRREKNKERRV